MIVVGKTNLSLAQAFQSNPNDILYVLNGISDPASAVWIIVLLKSPLLLSGKPAEGVYVLGSSATKIPGAFGKGSHFVKLFLGPTIKGMVVTLGALQARSKKDTHGVGHVVELHSLIAGEVSDASIPSFPHRSGG